MNLNSIKPKIVLIGVAGVATMSVALLAITLFERKGMTRLIDTETDRIMLCGSMEMIKDLAHICEAHGMKEGSNAEPGDFVLERAFVG